jgi:hypothetical protein
LISGARVEITEENSFKQGTSVLFSEGVGNVDEVNHFEVVHHVLTTVDWLQKLQQVVHVVLLKRPLGLAPQAVVQKIVQHGRRPSECLRDLGSSENFLEEG